MLNINFSSSAPLPVSRGNTENAGLTTPVPVFAYVYPDGMHFSLQERAHSLVTRLDCGADIPTNQRYNVRVLIDSPPLAPVTYKNVTATPLDSTDPKAARH